MVAFPSAFNNTGRNKIAPMLIPYSVDVPMGRLPVANWTLIGVTVLITVAAWQKQQQAEKPISPPIGIDALNEMARRGASTEEMQKAIRDQLPTALPPFLSLQPDDFSVWQLFTYPLAHGGIIHLVGNMVFLFVFGNAVNAKVGHWLFLVCYFLFGALGG